jgi:hypothetical protein
MLDGGARLEESLVVESGNLRRIPAHCREKL